MRTFTRTVQPVATADHVAALFARQYGVASRRQLRDAGVTPAAERRRLELGEWESVASDVIALCGVPDDWRRRPMAATLASARVGITGPTALRVHALDGFATEEDVYVVARLGDKPRLPDGCYLWRSRRLATADLMVLDGIRVTIAPTALVHAAPLVEADRFGKAVDDLLRRDVSPGWVQTVADRWRGPGVPGSGRLSAALAERCDQRLPRSWFERMARRAFRAHNIKLEHEVPVYDGTKRLAYLDLADIELQVGVECQSWAWHATQAARRADAARKRRLRRIGWEIVELWWSDRDRMGDAVDDVRSAMERQRVLLGR